MAGAEQEKPSWQPLSVREGRAEPEGPYEGVPHHLRETIVDWLFATLDAGSSFTSATLADDIALQLRVSGDNGYSRLQWLLFKARADQDKALDIIDATLFATEGATADELDAALALGGSVWKVNDDQDGLTRRVTVTEQESYESATTQADIASEQLKTAWSKVYGRQPDYSDAWDHAIKACEALLAPIVTPKAATPTLGSIISGIEAKSSKYKLGLASSSKTTTNVDTFVGMLRLIWPNPDRHETGASRPPTEGEARRVLHLAVLVVNWVRQGGFSEA